MISLLIKANDKIQNKRYKINWELGTWKGVEFESDSYPSAW
jgi:hypothetical protein